MRRTRRIILVLIALILAVVAVSWRARKALQSQQSHERPGSLPESISAQAQDWCWDEAREGKPIVRVCAKDMKNTSEGKIELTGVDLQLFHADALTYDKVRSAKADFDPAEGVLFSEGEVEITMGVPVDPKAKPSSRLVTIKTSGARFESKTGKASTDRAAEFQFRSGQGQCTGALYDPATRELQMHKDVRLHWKGDTPEAKPMEVEAGSLIYKEVESRIWLLPWSKFKRDTLAMEGGAAIVALNEGLIESIEAQQAKGTDTRPKQQTHYSADTLTVRFNSQGVLQSVVGDKNAKLLSTTPTARTNVDAARLDLEFHAENDDSVLKKALGTGGTVVTSSPVPRQGIPLADTRIMRSDVIAVYMRPGGEHMEHVDAEAPGTIEFLPNRSGQKRRVVTGNQMKILYAENNEVKAFQAVDVTTRSESQPVKGKPAQPPALTWSKGMVADFEPKTGAMNKLEQWGDFRYQEGDRRASSERAELLGPSDEVFLSGSARIWDPTGSTSANTIHMHQKTGDFEATGKVTSTRLPDRKKDKSAPGMLSGEEPLQAKAARMIATDQNRTIVYEENALMWQGANRIQADRIRIDRAAGRLEARGKVESQLLEKANPAAKKAQVFTVVRAPELDYDDKQRLAHYRGGAVLNRGSLVVTAREIRAFLKAGGDSSLDHAYADGDVKIVETSPERTRTGTAERAEYWTDAAKVVLSGGEPMFVDSVQGTTRGQQITFYSNQDRLIVEGGQDKPVRSRIPRKGD